MKHNMLAMALCFAVAGSAFALTKDEHKAAKDKIEATAKADKKACDAMKDNAKDVCMAEARGKENVAKAELEASYKPGARADEKVRIAKANAAYGVAKEKCDEMKGKDKSACQKDAKAAEKKAKDDARAEKRAAEKSAKEAAKPAKAAASSAKS